MPRQWFTPAGKYIRHIPPQNKRYYAIIDAMCAEHDWLTTGTASYKFNVNKISEILLKFI